MKFAPICLLLFFVSQLAFGQSMICNGITIEVKSQVGEVVTVSVNRTSTSGPLNSPTAAIYRVVDLADGQCIDCDNLGPGVASAEWKIRNTSGNATFQFAQHTGCSSQAPMKLIKESTACGGVTLTLKGMTGNEFEVEVDSREHNHLVNGPSNSIYKLIDLENGECITCPNLKNEKVTWQIRNGVGPTKLFFTSLNSTCEGLSLQLDAQ